MTDAELAADLAERAGSLLLQIRDAGGRDREGLGQEADRSADQFLVEAIRSARPEDGLLSEERECDEGRLDKSRVWIIDPLDGTREYSEGRDDWAVHVALCTGGEALVGAVALPSLGLVLRSDRPTPPTQAGAPTRLVVSRSRPPAAALEAAGALGAEVAMMGSAGAKAMAVVRGEADIYLHLGGQHEWDSAAPVAVATAHGYHCSRIDGSPLRYNQPDPYLPDLLICRPELAASVLRALRSDNPAGWR